MFFKMLDFHPLPGLTSPHLQMLLSNFAPCGYAPPSDTLLIPLEDGDKLSCHVSTPSGWKSSHPTLMLLHGLGGSHQSGYMIRLARKFYVLGFKIVRMNLRGCGSGVGLNARPYNGGNSSDVKAVLEALKIKAPLSPITLVGFSLGGNIALKLGGELGKQAVSLLHKILTVCPVLDLAQSSRCLSHRSNWFYHQYYLRQIRSQGKKWMENHRFSSLYEFDGKVTAPLWGYLNADDYYEKCSSCKFIPNIHIPCHILLAKDDPFIDHTVLEKILIPSATEVWLATYGSHMGFLGWSERGIHWLDQLLVRLIVSLPFQ